MLRTTLLSALGCGAVLLSANAAGAATLNVPAQYPTIQAAVDAAAPGDKVRVSRGSYCGATLTKPVSLEGKGHPRIIGCATSPMISPGLRAGFFLPGSQGVNPASGSSIRGFVFDGQGISNANLEPLSFGVFARFATDVSVERNRFIGTVQAITNTAGDRWRIRRNRIQHLTLFDCTRHCTGGDGIVISVASGRLAAPGGSAAPLNRPEDNLVAGNVISGTAPDGFSVFSMVGVLLLSADRTSVRSNVLRLRDNPNADAMGQGILLTNTCCGLANGYLPGTRFTTVERNDARKSEVGIVVEGTGGANTEGLVLRKNRGSLVLEGEPQALGAFRVIAPVRAQPQL
jgi:nitrous oxidase accessory protein NosD